MNMRYWSHRFFWVGKCCPTPESRHRSYRRRLVLSSKVSLAAWTAPLYILHISSIQSHCHFHFHCVRLCHCHEKQTWDFYARTKRMVSTNAIGRNHSFGSSIEVPRLFFMTIHDNPLVQWIVWPLFGYQWNPLMPFCSTMVPAYTTHVQCAYLCKVPGFVIVIIAWLAWISWKSAVAFSPSALRSGWSSLALNSKHGQSFSLAAK